MAPIQRHLIDRVRQFAVSSDVFYDGLVNEVVFHAAVVGHESFLGVANSVVFVAPVVQPMYNAGREDFGHCVAERYRSPIIKLSHWSFLIE